MVSIGETLLILIILAFGWLLWAYTYIVHVSRSGRFYQHDHHQTSKANHPMSNVEDYLPTSTIRSQSHASETSQHPSKQRSISYFALSLDTDNHSTKKNGKQMSEQLSLLVTSESTSYTMYTLLSRLADSLSKENILSILDHLKTTALLEIPRNETWKSKMFFMNDSQLIQKITESPFLDNLLGQISESLNKGYPCSGSPYSSTILKGFMDKYLKENALQPSIRWKKPQLAIPWKPKLDKILLSTKITSMSKNVYVNYPTDKSMKHHVRFATEGLQQKETTKRSKSQQNQGSNSEEETQRKKLQETQQDDLEMMSVIASLKIVCSQLEDRDNKSQFINKVINAEKQEIQKMDYSREEFYELVKWIIGDILERVVIQRKPT